MKRIFLPLAFKVLLSATFLFATACGDDPKPPPPPQPKAYGYPCEADKDCSSTMCIDKHCSKLCAKFADCPPAAGTYFVCGRATADKVACYPKTYDSRPYGTGWDCSIDGKCGIGWKCLGVPGAPHRYCSPICKSDKECAPKMRCAEIQDGKDKPEKRCVTRAWGHPCDIDDQCGGSEDLCITDTKGNRYCSKSCDKTQSATCPAFAKCEDAGNSKLQCKHKAGFAYTQDGKLCDPCVLHYEHQQGGDVVGVREAHGCQEGGECLRLSPYTNETACAAPCAKDFEKTCVNDTECQSRRCVETKDGGKKCSYCPENFGCLTKISLCVPIQENPQPPPDVIIGTCFK
ncbi:MAG: hypothetical protein KAI47_23485 [Deltaproteobacteria bacterium]|nr:hypothetical protein [Deltaproteobacteria bacterium]